ncbi:MAG: hypothetical protein D3910_05470, partial [Candidatus Electrothrix sp. ATG2]|nr:hypothetical protein [Candidatus Electrothrix sp. ATG2]
MISLANRRRLSIAIFGVAAIVCIKQPAFAANQNNQGLPALKQRVNDLEAIVTQQAALIAQLQNNCVDTTRSDSEILSVVSGAGYVTGAHTVDTTRSDADILSVVSQAGYVPGPHTPASVLAPYVTGDADD